MCTGGGRCGTTQRCSFFPLFLKLAGRRVVVVGGGPVATSKLRALLDAGAAVHGRRPADDARYRRRARCAHPAPIRAGRPGRRLARGGGGDARRQPRRGGSGRGAPAVRQRGRRSTQRQRLSGRGRTAGRHDVRHIYRRPRAGVGRPAARGARCAAAGCGPRAVDERSGPPAYPLARRIGPLPARRPALLDALVHLYEPPAAGGTAADAER